MCFDNFFFDTQRVSFIRSSTLVKFGENYNLNRVRDIDRKITTLGWVKLFFSWIGLNIGLLHIIIIFNLIINDRLSYFF